MGDGASFAVTGDTYSLTLHGRIKINTAEQRTIIQQSDWYTGR